MTDSVVSITGNRRMSMSTSISILILYTSTGAVLLKIKTQKISPNLDTTLFTFYILLLITHNLYLY